MLVSLGRQMEVVIPTELLGPLWVVTHGERKEDGFTKDK